MSARTFGALVAHDGITLVEYRAERDGLRVIDQWHDAGRSASIDEALSRLTSLVTTIGVARPRIAIAVEQFGVLHHLMTLPAADDSVLLPIVKREVQRVFGVTDPIVTFSRGAVHERRNAARADVHTAPSQLFVAAAPASTVDALASLGGRGMGVEMATAVPKAIHSLYEAASTSSEPTAVLVCLESGPHLAFFLDGRLELAIDPPIALEGDRATMPMILDQVERGAVYFRQQFRGAAPARILLAARADEYDALASALESRLTAQVKPLFNGARSPEAVVAMGAVLEARRERPLDIYPHPPTLGDRASSALRGPNAFVAVAAAVAAIAAVWSVDQVVGLSSVRRENAALRGALAAAVPMIEPMRRVAEQRADVVKQATFLRGTTAERDLVTRTLASLGASASSGIVFDSIRVSRTRAGWSGAVQGRSRGAGASQAVYALDNFLRAVRGQPNVTSATLDDFEFGSAADSAQAIGGGSVSIHFHLSFVIQARGENR